MNPAVVPQMKGIAAVPKVIAPRVAEVSPKTAAVVDETTRLRSTLRLAVDVEQGHVQDSWTCSKLHPESGDDRQETCRS